MSRVFADAFFYIAVLNRRDAAHRRALTVLSTGALEVVTTAAVLLEVADAMASPERRTVCAQFLEAIRLEKRTIVYPVDDTLWARGLELYRQRPDKEWSLTDCISFVVMQDEKLDEALTGDRHFEQAGFKALLKE